MSDIAIFHLKGEFGGADVDAREIAPPRSSKHQIQRWLAQRNFPPSPPV
jgi:hypothetical protein